MTNIFHLNDSVKTTDGFITGTVEMVIKDTVTIRNKNGAFFTCLKSDLIKDTEPKKKEKIKIINLGTLYKEEN